MVVVHAFIPGVGEAGKFLSLGIAWFTKEIPGELELHKETVSKTKQITSTRTVNIDDLSADVWFQAWSIPEKWHGRRELTPLNCPLTSTRTLHCKHTPPPTHTHTIHFRYVGVGVPQLRGHISFTSGVYIRQLTTTCNFSSRRSLDICVRNNMHIYLYTN